MSSVCLCRVSNLAASDRVRLRACALYGDRPGTEPHGYAGRGNVQRPQPALKLRGWLVEAGFTKADWGTNIYPAALTKCFPGRVPGKSTDRAPSRHERALCRPWLDRQIALVSPSVLLLFGKLAIDTFLGPGAMTERIGHVFKWRDIICIPLPHSSGASTWLNTDDHRLLLREAIARVAEHRQQMYGAAGTGSSLP